MAKISDEIRMFVKRSYADEYMDPRELLALADRIDAEMVELPRDADGKPIHLGDTVYDLDGYEHMVVSLRLYGEEDPWWTVSIGMDVWVHPSCLTHERPDSLERIADELVEFADAYENRDLNTEMNRWLHAIADRIRAQSPADRLRELDRIADAMDGGVE